MNTYLYAKADPLRFRDFNGLDPYDWNGPGDTSTCNYYDQLAKDNPKCGYFPKAADICRGKNTLVNGWTNLGLLSAWTGGSLKDSQATVLNDIRSLLIMGDKAARSEGLIDKNGCTCGNEVNRYHNDAFDFAGMPKWSYGGNVWPQGVPPNPVPKDPRPSGSGSSPNTTPNSNGATQ